MQPGWEILQIREEPHNWEMTPPIEMDSNPERPPEENEEEEGMIRIDSQEEMSGEEEEIMEEDGMPMEDMEDEGEVDEQQHIANI